MTYREVSINFPPMSVNGLPRFYACIPPFVGNQGAVAVHEWSGDKSIGFKAGEVVAQFFGLDALARAEQYAAWQTWLVAKDHPRDLISVAIKEATTKIFNNAAER